VRRPRPAARGRPGRAALRRLRAAAGLGVDDGAQPRRSAGLPHRWGPGQGWTWSSSRRGGITAHLDIVPSQGLAISSDGKWLFVDSASRRRRGGYSTVAVVATDKLAVTDTLDNPAQGAVARGLQGRRDALRDRRSVGARLRTAEPALGCSKDARRDPRHRHRRSEPADDGLSAAARLVGADDLESPGRRRCGAATGRRCCVPRTRRCSPARHGRRCPPGRRSTRLASPGPPPFRRRSSPPPRCSSRGSDRPASTQPVRRAGTGPPPPPGIVAVPALPLGSTRTLLAVIVVHVRHAEYEDVMAGGDGARRGRVRALLVGRCGHVFDGPPADLSRSPA